MTTCLSDRTLVALGLACTVFGPAAGAAEGDGSTPRQLMRRAVEQALVAQGLAIESGSVESGQLVTASTPLNASDLGGLVRPGDAPLDTAWARAEYRLAIRLSIALDGWMTSEVRAHILAWPSVAASLDGPAGAILLSNSTLEQRFMRAVSAEIDRMAHLFPPEPAESKTAESPAASAAPSK